MTLYHMSQTLKFVHALENGLDFFCDMVANGQPHRTVPDKLVCLERNEYLK